MARYSVEQLWHFRCDHPRCKKWWTIADFVPAMQPRITCPRCGRTQDYYQIHEIPDDHETD